MEVDVVIAGMWKRGNNFLTVNFTKLFQVIWYVQCVSKNKRFIATAMFLIAHAWKKYSVIFG